MYLQSFKKLSGLSAKSLKSEASLAVVPLNLEQKI